jgi:hypothetical protein
VLGWLESSQVSASIRDELWGWPLILTLHEFGTAVVVGFVLIIGLRLLGMFETIPYGTLNRLFPVIWIAMVLQFLTGFALWMTKPAQYVVDVAFVLKLAFVVLGIILIFRLRGVIKREAAAKEAEAASSHWALIVAATMLVWCSVVVTGRLTAFLGSL